MIRPYQDRDHNDVVDLFFAVQKQTFGGYPSRLFLEKRFNLSGWSAIAEWLDANANADGSLSPRFVYPTDKADKAIGHYQLEDLAKPKIDYYRDYIIPAFPDYPAEDLVLIEKFVIAPDHQGEGLGRGMLTIALRFIQEQLQSCPVFVCLADQREARQLFESNGALLVSRFTDVGGEEAVGYMFVS